MPGFLGTPAALIPDIVVVAMFLVLPAFFYGAWLAKKGKTKIHARIMSGVFTLLFVVVVIFVIWNQVANDYQVNWKDKPFYKDFFLPFVFGHIVIALSGLFTGAFVLLTALKWREPNQKGELVFKSAKHRKIHIWAGRLALLLFLLIAVTGLIIYYYRYVFVFTE